MLEARILLKIHVRTYAAIRHRYIVFVYRIESVCVCVCVYYTIGVHGTLPSSPISAVSEWLWRCMHACMHLNLWNCCSSSSFLKLFPVLFRWKSFLPLFHFLLSFKWLVIYCLADWLLNEEFFSFLFLYVCVYAIWYEGEKGLLVLALFYIFRHHMLSF